MVFCLYQTFKSRYLILKINSISQFWSTMSHLLSTFVQISGFIYCFLILTVFGADKLRFDNYRVYSLSVETLGQLEKLQQLENYSGDVMLFKSPVLNRTSEMLVAPHKIAEVLGLFNTLKLKFSLKTHNIQKWVNKI